MIEMGGPGHGDRGHHVGGLAINGSGSALLDPPDDPPGPARAQGAGGAAEDAVARRTGEGAQTTTAAAVQQLLQKGPDLGPDVGQLAVALVMLGRRRLVGALRRRFLWLSERHESLLA
jgi:hypothetical protein